MILVTGATGLLGAHLLREGLAQGRQLRAVARSVPRRSLLHTLRDRVDVHEVDLLAGELGPVLVDVDTVVHAAAVASPRPQDAGLVWRSNVELTQRLFEAAERAGVRRWLQVSSVATKSGGPQPIDESCDAPRDTAYARSKHEADRYLASRAGGPVQVTTVYPTFMLGPYDARPSSGGLFLALRARVMKSFVNCTKNFVAAGDVAKGTWAALERGSGGHYLLGGKDLELRVFLGRVLERLGLPPDSLAELDALPDDPIVRELCTPSMVSSARARRELGYVPTADPFVALDEHLAYLATIRLLRLKPESPLPGRGEGQGEGTSG